MTSERPARRRLPLILCLAIALLIAFGAAGYHRISSVACSTPAFTTWDAGGKHGARACLVYLALGPSDATAAPARGEPAPSAKVSKPSPRPSTPVAATAPQTSQPSTSATTPATPAPSPVTPSSTAAPQAASDDGVEVADFADHTVNCGGGSYRFWQETARAGGRGSTCRDWAIAVGLDQDGAEQLGNPYFDSSGDAQRYYYLLEQESAD